MKMRLMKKFGVCLLTGVMTVGLLAGCGASSSGTASGGSSSSKIMLVTTDRDDAYRKLLMDGIVQAVSEAGVALDEEDCGNDVEAQVEAVRKAAEDGYGAVICRLADASTAAQIELAAGNLPVIYVNNQPDESALSPDKYMYVASNETESGKDQAEYVIQKLGKKDMNIIIMEGEKGHSATVARTAAVKNTLTDNGITYNVVFMDYANWSDTEARQKLNLFFRTGQSVDAIFCNNDTMALGAVEALKDNGLDPAQIPVTGVDATADGCKSIQDGEMAFTVFQNANGQAAKAIEIATALASGKSAKGIEGVSDDLLYGWVPFEAVDASNVADYMN